MSIESDNARIEKNLNLRDKLIDELIEMGATNRSKTDNELLVKLMDGTDRTILGKARLKQDETNSKSAKEIAQLLSGVLINLDSTRRDNSGLPPLLDSSVTITDIVTGEMDVGAPPLRYEDFS